MRAGSLNRFVAVRRNVVTGSDPAYNVPIVEEVTAFTLWASLFVESDDEAVSGAQVYASRVCTFRMQFFDLHPTDTLLCEGKRYNILGIHEIGLRRGLEVKARAGE